MSASDLASNTRRLQAGTQTIVGYTLSRTKPLLKVVQTLYYLNPQRIERLFLSSFQSERQAI